MKTLYRIWWIPQVGPMNSVMYRNVPDENIGAQMLDLLADYDLFQFHNKIKPDYANTGGLEVKYGIELWEEWEDEDGNDYHILLKE